MTGWPWPSDTPLVIARKVATVYREHLRLNDRTLCNTVDDGMRAYGQLWIVPQLETANPTDDVTTAEAAALASVDMGMTVKPTTIRQWACTPHKRPEYPGHMLLPRFGWRGRERTYLVAHVHAAAHIALTEHLTRQAA